MGNTNEKLVIVASRGHDDERATVAWTIANGGQNTGLDVTMFLVSAGIDLVRKGAAANVRMNPFDPSMKELIDGFLERGGKIMAGPPCTAVRGYSQEDLEKISMRNAMRALRAAEAFAASQSSEPPIETLIKRAE